MCDMRYLNWWNKIQVFINAEKYLFSCFPVTRFLAFDNVRSSERWEWQHGGEVNDSDIKNEGGHCGAYRGTKTSAKLIGIPCSNEEFVTCEFGKLIF